MNFTKQNNPKGLISQDSLTSKQRDEMFALLSRHFEGVTRERFEVDLAEKNWIIEIREKERLVGFSTLFFGVWNFEGCDLVAIFSGDTIVAPEAWARPTLARTWIAAVNHLRNQYPSHSCYWLLLTSGFRTYRFLPVFWKEFYPRPGTPTPALIQRLLDFLAANRYSKAYDSSRGIVRFQYPQRLRESLQEIPSGRDTNAHVAFFLQSNPGHFKGDELVCITEIRKTNLTPAGLRMIR